MSISVFDLFKVGIGPSSSHTVGPMRASHAFVSRLEADGRLAATARVHATLYGSLGATGRGHGTDKAVLLGLEGETPEGVDIESIEPRMAAIAAGHGLKLLGRQAVAFRPAEDLLFRGEEVLPGHPNAMRLAAFSADGGCLLDKTYYSVGGGFVVEAGMEAAAAGEAGEEPHVFANGEELVALCKRLGEPVSAVMLANETARRSPAEVRAGLLHIWNTMQECVRRGCATDGILPGGMRVRRRAAELHRKLSARPEESLRDPLAILDWVQLYALAVSEENAAGGRIVTAPTNGAAGIVPAVLHYYHRFVPGADEAGVMRFLLTAAAIGILYKKNASISGAEVGCQGEIGVASSMAAGALAEVLGGTPEQVENAAEIAMEHNLGLTCDPVGGLVQVPCIERNAVGTVKAITAARLALRGDGEHRVSLDQVIRTMRDTGADMNAHYKETARGGLAIHVVEC